MKFLAVIDSLEKISIGKMCQKVFHTKYYPILEVECLNINNLNITWYELSHPITRGTWELKCFGGHASSLTANRMLFVKDIRYALGD